MQNGNSYPVHRNKMMETIKKWQNMGKDEKS